MTAPSPIVMCDLAAQRARLEPGLSQAIQRVLDHGQFILGPEVFQLEQELASFCGAHHVVTCANGTDALELVLMAEGIGPGDAVIVPSFTFVATAEAVAKAGATPIFADVDRITFNINPESSKRCLMLARKLGLLPRAIIAVDLFGMPADYASLRRITDTHNVLLIADAAQSFGAHNSIGAVGTLGDYTTTSFFPSKPLGCYGDGGAIFTDDSSKADLLQSIRFHGRGFDKYDNVRVGSNSRLDTLQAAVLLSKLRIFRNEIEQRRMVANYYANLFSDSVPTPYEPSGSRSVWAQYTLTFDNSHFRELAHSSCSKASIATAIYYPKPVHQQVGYQGFPSDPRGLEHSEYLAGRVLSLPMHPYLTSTDQDFIAETLLSTR